MRMEVLGCTYREKGSYLKSKHCDLKEEQVIDMIYITWIITKNTPKDYAVASKQ